MVEHWRDASQVCFQFPPRQTRRADFPHKSFLSASFYRREHISSLPMCYSLVARLQLHIDRLGL
jgi:hypothetical protein